MHFCIFLAFCLTVEEAGLAIKVLPIWVHSAIKRHDDSKVHKENKLSFRLLGTIDVRVCLNKTEKAGVEAHNNKKVQENLEILGEIVRAILLWKLWISHDETENSRNQGIFKGLLDYEAEKKPKLREHGHLMRSRIIF